jgi:Dyp-type peroxidase family
VEHFGYVDGRSQPLFLAEDLEREAAAYAAEPALAGADTGFDPAFPPSQFILPDPNARTPLGAGSYFVFRKLEQRVRAFKQQEEALAEALGLTGEDAERAGAMVVGRFEDGTPVVLSDAATTSPPPNNFSYANDPDGMRCPFQAHIRKTNPRGESTPKLPPGAPPERSHIMARRGIPFGDATRDFEAGAGQEPEGEVGLLFMAYMASIGGQFEFTQQVWANNPRFLRGLAPGEAPTGIDPIIGQGGDRAARTQDWPAGQGKPMVPFSFADFVRMQGGEYFFAPSRSFLREVGL